MKSFKEFCSMYSLDPEAPDSQIHYQQYCEAFAMLEIVTEWGAADETH